jgi:hypothetical protein
MVLGKLVILLYFALSVKFNASFCPYTLVVANPGVGLLGKALSILCGYQTSFEGYYLVTV